MGERTQKALSRLLNQFKESNNLVKFFTAFLNRMEDSDLILEKLATLRFKDNATGVWQDIIGDIVGLYPRPAQFVDDNTIFTYRKIGDPNDPTKGYSAIGFQDGGHYQSLYGIPNGSYITDTDYLIYINAKVLATYSIGTINDIYNVIKEAFGIDTLVTVPRPGNIDIELLSSLTYRERTMLLALIPVVGCFNARIINWP